MQPRLIIFGRAPSYGVGKRRLARDVGNLKAWQFSRRNLALTKRGLLDPRWQLAFCATPDKRCMKGDLPQGQGDLGQRLMRQFQTRRPVLIMGSDVPDISPTIIAEAVKLLNRPGAVLGPSSDGGFWLIGLAHKRLPITLFDGIGWSQATTRDQVVQRLKRFGCPIRFTTAKDDVDDGPAYDSWRRGISSTKLQGR